jgi:PEP-CTERM motif
VLWFNSSNSSFFTRAKMTKKKKLCFSAAMFTTLFVSQLQAGTMDFSFRGPDISGISGSLRLTYGAATDAIYSNAFEVTGISGTFSDSTLGLVNVGITSLVAITRDTPHAGNLLAPNDFSRFTVATGTNGGSLSYDNLVWPAGSPQTATSYARHGGFFDIYGLLFNIGGGKVVNLWSNGYQIGDGPGPVEYGVAVATPDALLHRVGGGVSQVPEPGTLSLLGLGLVGLLAWRRTKSGCRFLFTQA